jgi:hypothetical protein
MAMTPRRGAFAFCGKGTLGLITSDTPIGVVYSDGKTGTAYVGIHLTDKIAPIGSPWSSRDPEVVGYTDEIADTLKEMLDDAA